MIVCLYNTQRDICTVHAEASWYDSRTWTLIMFTYILGLFGSWRLSWIWFRLRLLVGTRALFWRLILEFSSLQQQTQHIICVSIADHSRRWLLSRVALQPWSKRQELQIEFYFHRALFYAMSFVCISYTFRDSIPIVRVLWRAKIVGGSVNYAPSTSMCTHFNGCRNTKTTASHLGLLIGTLSNIRRVGQPS